MPQQSKRALSIIPVADGARRQPEIQNLESVKEAAE
jgi:hypothetical protein